MRKLDELVTISKMSASLANLPDRDLWSSEKRKEAYGEMTFADANEFHALDQMALHAENTRRDTLRAIGEWPGPCLNGLSS